MPSINEIIVTARVRANCVICGRESVLGATCSRCGKQSCHRKQCVKLINEPGQCKAVPIKKEERRNGNKGDRLATK